MLFIVQSNSMSQGLIGSIWCNLTSIGYQSALAVSYLETLEVRGGKLSIVWGKKCLLKGQTG